MTIRHNIHDTIWFKNVTCGKSSICNLMCSITSNYDIISNIINHFGCVISITNMVVVNVPFDIIYILRGHHNLKTLKPYKIVESIHYSKGASIT